MTETDLTRAENRVREMSRLAQQYVEQSNSYMRNFEQNRQNNSTVNKGYNTGMQNNNRRSEARALRFEPMPTQSNRRQENTRNNRQDSQNSEKGSFNTRQPEAVTKSSADSPERLGSVHKKSGILDNLLPDMNIDEEKIILMALIALLFKEKADMKLLIALGYIIM